MLLILNNLKKHQRLNTGVMIVSMSLFCLGLSLLRIYLTGERTYLFLNWNLFLAFIPFGLSSYFLLQPSIKKSKLKAVITLFIWILFFPNAPYILTDLFHLRNNTGAPIWYDLVLIFSFAWTGLILGFISLMDLEKQIATFTNTKLSSIAVVLLLFLSAFGVYLGRFLRWNSWDIVGHPFALFQDIGSRLANPLEHPGTWGMTLSFGILLNLMYWGIKTLNRDH